MKRIVSLILAIMMIAALAIGASATSFEVREADDKYTTDASTLNTPKTELWLQVDATGQIDVTVPLVLVFKTDIDGGSATSPNTYKITNNSTADLVVTNIEVAEEAKSEANPMTLVAYSATPTEDQYKVQLSVDNSVVKGTGSTGAFDLHTTSHEVDAIAGGLFELKKATAEGVGTSTIVTADMTTGKLSFVTSRTGDDELDTAKGVKLLTVTYTVAVDTSDAIGTTITTTPNNPAQNG